MYQYSNILLIQRCLIFHHEFHFINWIPSKTHFLFRLYPLTPIPLINSKSLPHISHPDPPHHQFIVILLSISRPSINRIQIGNRINIKRADKIDSTFHYNGVGVPPSTLLTQWAVTSMTSIFTTLAKPEKVDTLGDLFLFTLFEVNNSFNSSILTYFSSSSSRLVLDK